MRTRKQQKDLWLTSYTGRFCVFSCIASILMLGLYMLGNYQNFQSSTMIALLSAQQISGFAWILCSIFYFIMLLAFIPYSKSLKVTRFILSLFSIVLSISFYSLMTFLLSWFS